MDGIGIRFYLSILLRRMPYFFVVAGTMTMIGLAIAYLLPPVYQASSKILVESPQIPTEMARPTVSTNAVEQLQIIEQEITTRENLLVLAERLAIYSASGTHLTEAEIVDNMRSRTTFEQLHLDTGGGGATIFSISFEAREPALSAKVVNELVALVLNRNMRLRTGRAGDTMQFFDQEVDRLVKELTRLETAILGFKNANKEALPDSIDFRRNQQSRQQERLLLLEREEAGLRTRRNNLAQMMESAGQLGNSGAFSSEHQLLQDLNRALADQLTIFSEMSPSVAALRARIASVQSGLISKESAGASKARPTETDLQLSEIDERLDYIARERSSITQYLEELNTSIAATPENESKLNTLERARTNMQAQYNTAIAKQAEASIGEQIEIRSKGGRISVVEPAIPPERPISPNRNRIVGLGLFIGILLGASLVVLLELMDRTIKSPKDLTLMLQKQPLATVPYIWIDGEKRSRRLKQAFGLVFASCVVLAFLTVVQVYREPLGTAVEALLLSTKTG